jgi:hypothetical protein
MRDKGEKSGFILSWYELRKSSERLRKVEQLKKIQFGWEIKGQNDKR